ncbi:XRE family transcriptional regulator [Streptococcus sp. NLN64]|uniref:XRE family transcriptional regulator n=1 Tax=Streptococcus sp. NLN64 TaxID=2822799 RepID=UPI0018CA84BD|nr:XRE family transcriptional regulator [Streptococcus sp. NLN64]MBG9367682.1 helix-turn-helix transcriptional regulator [Streptococcus sp. NLN64]
MSILGNSIKMIRKSKRLTQKNLAKLTGFKQNTISNHENGKRNLSEKDIHIYASALSVSPQDLFDSSKTKSSSLDHPDSIKKLNTKLNKENHTKWINYGNELLEEQNQMIKEDLYEYQVYEKLSAGTGSSYFNDGNFDTVYFDKKLDHDFASWIYGDSMEPRFLNGEVALIKDTGFDYDGAIYAVEWDGQTYIKKVERKENGLRLISLNPKYIDKFAPYDENPRIIGKIVGSFQPISI